MSIKNTLVGEQFRLIQKIGQGSFGKVYIANDLQNNNLPVAIKTESLHQTFSQLLREIQNFKVLEGIGFPPLLKQGISVDNEFVYLVTNLLGPSLEDLFNLCGCKFTLKTTLMLFYQLLERLQHMHAKHYIHRDIKPDNILMGLAGESNTVHMIDFGLTRLVIDPKTGKHIPFVSGKNLIGTIRYVSVNSHMGHELSRRDDLITLGYVIVNFLKGGLPWQDVKVNKPSARYRKVGKIKEEYSNYRLCQSCPSQFLTYMDYVTNLRFEEAADFNMLKTLVLEAAGDANLNIFDNVFDWSLLLTQQKMQRISSVPRALENNQLQNNNRQFSSAAQDNRKRDVESEPDYEQKYEKARNFRFHTFNDVKVVIHQAYSKKIPKKKETDPEPKPRLRSKSKQKSVSFAKLPRKSRSPPLKDLDVRKYVQQNNAHAKNIPEIAGEESPQVNQAPEEEKKAKPQRRQVKCDEADPRPYMFYDVDVRKPKRVSKKNVRKPIGIQFLSECSDDDSRGQSFNHYKKRANFRVASNQIDRFGRIAFNKNKELSQASLDVDHQEESFNGDGQEEEKKGMRNDSPRPAMLKGVIPSKFHQTDGQVRNLARQKHWNQMNRNNNKNDPMELEFTPQKIITRLDNMKNVLQSGKVVNQIKLHQEMGAISFEQSKKYHQTLQAKQRIELEEAQLKLQEAASERQKIHKQVEDQMKQKDQVRAIGVKQAFASFANHRQFAAGQMKKKGGGFQPIQFQSKAAPKEEFKESHDNRQRVEDLEELSDCSGEVPDENEDYGVQALADGAGQAAAYKPKNYQEEYQTFGVKLQNQVQKKS